MRRDLTLHRCKQCGKHRGGDLLPFENFWYCREHWLHRLQWHEQREEVTRHIRSMVEFDEAVARVDQRYGMFLTRVNRTSWRGFIEECAGLAEWALTCGDRRTFVYYFSRAMWAWELSEEV